MLAVDSLMLWPLMIYPTYYASEAVPQLPDLSQHRNDIARNFFAGSSGRERISHSHVSVRVRVSNSVRSACGLPIPDLPL